MPSQRDKPDLRQEPRVSIVMPCYNHGQYVGEAIQSVLAQTLAAYEIIVVDDGSTDPETVRVLDHMEGRGVRLIRTSNRGPAAARNTAISAAKGGLILPLDADDRIAPHFLETAVALMDSDPSVAVVTGRVECFGERTGELQLPEFTPARLLLDNMLVASSMFRRTAWECAGGYREDLRGWEDWDFWLSVLADGGTVERLDQVVLYYRICDNSRDRALRYSSKLGLMLKMLVRHRAMYLRYWRPCLSLLALKMSRRATN